MQGDVDGMDGSHRTSRFSFLQHANVDEEEEDHDSSTTPPSNLKPLEELRSNVKALRTLQSSLSSLTDDLHQASMEAKEESVDLLALESIKTLHDTCLQATQQILRIRRIVNIKSAPTSVTHRSSARESATERAEQDVNELGICEGLKLLTKKETMRIDEFDALSKKTKLSKDLEKDRERLEKKVLVSKDYNKFRAKLTAKATDQPRRYYKYLEAIEEVESVFEKLNKQHENLSMRGKDMERFMLANTATLAATENRRDTSLNWMLDMLNNYKLETTSEKKRTVRLRMEAEIAKVERDRTLERCAFLEEEYERATNRMPPAMPKVVPSSSSSKQQNVKANDTTRDKCTCVPGAILKETDLPKLMIVANCKNPYIPCVTLHISEKIMSFGGLLIVQFSNFLRLPHCSTEIPDMCNAAATALMLNLLVFAMMCTGSAGIDNSGHNMLVTRETNRHNLSAVPTALHSCIRMTIENI
eukprot:jgi/Bigna1/91391/estExt_fgenesh1_pg.C_990041